VIAVIAFLIPENADEDDPDAEGGLDVAGEAEVVDSAAGASEGAAEDAPEVAVDEAGEADTGTDAGEAAADELDSENE